ncbi:MAG: protein-ADP-ribose hydrolase [Oscillospiraceae bacterium]|nr:protein-ADP-ribose hydrolase [Oscillospiraceae bacterium]
MTKKTTQEQRLDYLVEAFKTDSVEYKDLRTNADTESKQRLLRSLMNIRMPRPMAKETLLVQDEYLKERAEERGIVRLNRIPSIAESLGSKRPFADTLSLWQGDITCLAVDVIVNAANSRMLGCFRPCHSCIDNCIHTYAGIQLRAECHQQMQALRSRYGRNYEQPTALPMLTDGYNLPAKKVVHIVGPIVFDELTPDLENDLADCYRNTLNLCAKNGLRSVAFCSISTGVFRFPKKRASEIAVQTVMEWLATHPGKVDRVIFNVFSDKDRCIYEQTLQ